MTNQELYQQEQDAKKAAIDARISSEIEAGFLNPWGEGVSYKQFLDNIPSGKTVREYLTGNLPADKEAELISWIENDLSHYAPYKDFLKNLEGNKTEGNKNIKNK